MKGFPSFSGLTRTEAHDLSILLRYTAFMLWGVVPGSSGARATYAAASGVSCSGSGAGSSGVDPPWSDPFAGTSSDFACSRDWEGASFPEEPDGAVVARYAAPARSTSKTRMPTGTRRRRRLYHGLRGENRLMAS